MSRQETTAEIVRPFGPQRDADACVLDFIREQGSVTTRSVGYRFGWTSGEAFRRLDALRRAGKVRATDFRYGDVGGGGKMNGWEIAA